ncbi:hypothetical protein [Pseudoruegeria sp. HB172150]|uniref:hypothetical protein n=1 Tax=Pseudoruegeria sp. HB172150 TaxID=2721164 RepID=UPI0015555E84|nr:hypothetical protein [Pseudoruegeria sp. HB172150]
MRRTLIALALTVPATLALAAETQLDDTLLPEGSVSEQDGLAAWDRIHEVLSHPRCSNCHVGEDNIPLWTATASGQARDHGMNIHGGDSRIGAEYLPCSSCHLTTDLPNSIPHAPPHAGLDWQLAPLEFQWTGKTSAEICAQLADPDRNGGRDLEGLVEHITHDVSENGFIAWGFAPGAGREPAPYDVQSHLDDFKAWGAAGMPCAPG